jgi:hypothetical protein
VAALWECYGDLVRAEATTPGSMREKFILNAETTHARLGCCPRGAGPRGLH